VTASADALRRVKSPDGTSLPVRVVAPPASTATLVLAHGAGTSMKHPSLVRLADALSARRITTVTFDFPYRARGGGAPDRMPVLVGAYRAVLESLSVRMPLCIGGRSLGGRVASHVAAEGAAVAGLVFLAFPLHPPGKPGIERAAHLAKITQPMLFVQGTRDTFARFDLLEAVVGKLRRATLHAIPEADHGFKVPKRTGRTEKDVAEEVAETVAGWMARLG
jgi:hypothetical protein